MQLVIISMDSPELARELEHVELLLRTSEGILKKVSASANPVQHYILIIDSCGTA